MRNPFLLFDLDGTISDPIEGIWRCFNYALDHFGHNVLKREEAAQYIGPPLDETFIALTGSTDSDRIALLVEKYRERFSHIGYAENTLYPGIKETIEFLHQNRAPLGICTSKRKDFAEKILTMFGLRKYFNVVSGGDIGIKKSQQIQSLLSENVIDGNTIMIGDRAVDLISAHNNGIRSAGVLWGYGSRAELESQLPAFLLEKPEELNNLLLLDSYKKTKK